MVKIPLPLKPSNTVSIQHPIGSGSSNYNTMSNQANNAQGVPKSTSKKLKPSFMEFYHSAPVKNPTNILEKYMKRKK